MIVIESVKLEVLKSVSLLSRIAMLTFCSHTICLTMINAELKELRLLLFVGWTYVTPGPVFDTMPKASQKRQEVPQFCMHGHYPI